MSNTYVAIMAGGIGSRFWPKSRVSKPKQFIDILGTGKTLIQATYARFLQICPKEQIYIVTNEDYRDLVHEQLPDLDDTQILGEPSRRNTAPCVAYVSNIIIAKNPDARIIVAPADHLITEEGEFFKVINEALDHVGKEDDLVTLGIRPTRPDTGYGYIQYLDNSEDKIYKVKTFTEKPNLELAKTFMRSGDFLWNSGIFIWRGQTILEAFKTHLPEIGEAFRDVRAKAGTDKEAEAISKAYSIVTNISIDYGIMEKAENVKVIPASFGWSDLGTWGSLYEMYGRDYLGNAVNGGQVMVNDATNCMIMAPDDKLVIVQGLDDFIVIDSEDVLLICQKEKEQEIKTITTEVRRKKGDTYL
ncbi:MAG: mannose-1-phosphate guanylyltransferase [Limisphaerales bacterium]|jgi:mannose-1-phosphate guanylyltransferase